MGYTFDLSDGIYLKRIYFPRSMLNIETYWHKDFFFCKLYLFKEYQYNQALQIKKLNEKSWLPQEYNDNTKRILILK